MRQETFGFRHTLHSRRGVGTCVSCYPPTRLIASCSTSLRDKERPAPRECWALHFSSNCGSSPMSDDQSTSAPLSSNTHADGPEDNSNQLSDGPYAITCCLPSTSTIVNCSEDGCHA